MIEYRLEVAGGAIAHAEIQGDFFGDRDVFELARRLEGSALTREGLTRSLGDVRVGDYVHGMENELLIEDLLSAEAL